MTFESEIIYLGIAQSMFVGNVICDASLATGFPTGSTGLEFQFFAPCLQGWKAFFGPAGQVTVDRGSHTGTKVGWAGVQVTQFLVQKEFLARLCFDGFLNSINALGKTFEDFLDITA